MLYKYLPEDRVDVLENLRIRFTQLLSLNDPFEYALKIGDSEYELVPELSAKAKDPIAFVSLSRNNTNLLMWSHYSDSHKGFCIGFHRTNSYFLNSEPVRYRKKRSSLNGIPIHSVGSNTVLKGVALEKAIDWSYEEEERLFLSDVEKNAVLNIGDDEWGQPIILNSYPKSSIGAIYLGLRVSTDLENRIMNALHTLNLNVPVFKAKKSITEFGLEFELRA